MKKNLLLTFALSCCMFVQAQAQQAEKTMWGKQDLYLARQTEKTFSLINDILQEKKNLPSKKAPSLERKAALYLMDAVLHDTRMDGSPVITQFIEGRYEAILEDMKKPLKKGLKIYKLYNDGFVVKSKSVTVAWDIVRGPKMIETPKLISNEVIQKIVGQCDIMFLSHNHGDHVDKDVVNMFIEAGKPVVAPTDVLKKNEKVIHTRSEEIVEKSFTAANGVKLHTTILPGHQDKMMNNIYVVTTPEGYTFTQTGDQWNKEDLSWVLDVHKHIKPLDVLMINCWANNLPETVKGFDPKLVLFGHENELGHTIDHREAYWLSYDKLEAVDRAKCLMTWAECYWYK